MFYDATGNLIEDAEHRYAYGPRNRLVAIDDGAQGLYRHNALGQRVYKYGRLSGTGLIGDVNQDGFVDQHDIHLVNGLGGVAFDCDGPGQGDENKNSDNNGKSGQNTPQGQTVACVATNIGDSKNNGKGNKQNNQGEIEITQTLLFAYDEQGRLLGEYEEDGVPVQETLWLGDLPVATIREGVAYRVYPDHLGTPRAVADQNDTLLWRWQSDPFGTTEADEDPDQDGQRFVYNLRFPGQYFDGETGRHYNYFRTYDPSTGRYLESDPIGLQGGLNTYAYVGSNPLSRIDPLGLYQMCHRDLQLPIPYARHCYARFDDGSTSSFDPNGVNPDPDPNQSGTTCTNPKEPEKDDCIKKAMQRCKGSNYDSTAFNCCHCVEQALKECGTSIPPSSWPNWPINPGPQPGEPGYSPNPVYGPGLGK